MQNQQWLHFMSSVSPAEHVHCTHDRLDEGMELVKQLERSYGHDSAGMGLDSLANALAGVSVERALRMLSLLRTRGGRPSRATLLRLMSACARSSHSHEARRLYWCILSEYIASGACTDPHLAHHMGGRSCGGAHSCHAQAMHMPVQLQLSSRRKCIGWLLLLAMQFTSAVFYQ